MGLTTITSTGGGRIDPLIVDVVTAKFSSQARTVLHDILDGPPVYTLRAALPASGTLRLVFATASDAAACEVAHRRASLFTITSAELPRLNFDYVVAPGGEVVLELDPDTAVGWVVEVPFQQVVA